MVICLVVPSFSEDKNEGKRMLFRTIKSTVDVCKGNECDWMSCPVLL